MQWSSLVMGVALSATLLPATALVVENKGYYQLSYDESSDLGGVSKWFGGAGFQGFGWSFNDSIQVLSDGGAPTSLVVRLPSFALSASGGWALSDPAAFLGKLAFTEVGGTVTTVLAGADVEVDGNAFRYDQGVGWTVTRSGPASNIGYFSGNASLPGSFSSLKVSNATLTLSASGGLFGSIQATDQNVLEISFNVTAVPEPAGLAMLASGLGVMAWLLRRRARR